ncbi:putative integral membrane protein [Colletotrichum sublineola]|uniref:Putative integral membrane protein n=1 Tax=Colletotrichum sublineola TaxID=1173701 RepID=A0A066XEY4_COLSU|nr:putative integral membrane protein [Colletotrichum sublineola]
MSNPPKGSEAWKAQDKGPAILAICWSFTALSSMFVFSRVYVRWKFVGKLYNDDYFVILGLICGYISTSLSTLAVASGTGRHLDVLTLEQQQNNMLWTTAAQCPGIMSFGLPKLAVICLLTRLLNPGVFHKWFLWWLGIWCQLTLAVTVVLLIGRCTPARALWDFSVTGTCFDPSILINYSIYAGDETPDLVVWTVIEGSTIIIASSIPVLHPLVDILLKRNPFASTRERTGRTARSDGDSPSPSSSKPRPSLARHTYELGQRKAKPILRDWLGFTIAEDESQEDMLSPVQNSYTQTVTSSNSGSSQVELGRIIRTDSVTIMYDEKC